MNSEWDNTPWAGDAVKAVRVTDENDTRMSWPLTYGALDWRSDNTSAGVHIGVDSALRISIVYACVRVLAETVASLPLHLYRRLPGGGKDIIYDHPLYPVLHDEPNPDMTSFVWRETMMSHLATWGNAYCEMTRDPFGRLQLWPLRPDRMEVGYENNRKVYDYIRANGQRQRMLPGTVFHVAGLSPNGLVGYAPITLHRDALGLYQAAQQFGTNTFRNNARPAVVLSHPKTLSTPAVDRLAKQFEELKGSNNAGKTVVLEEGLSVTEVGIPPKDAQYIEVRRFQGEEIARIFRMQPHMVGILDHATFSNIEHQSLDFEKHTVGPWLTRIEQEIQRQLITEPDVVARFNAAGLLRGDSKARAEALQLQRQNGVINADEWRAIENMNPIEDGSGKQYWRPANMVDVSDAPADVATEVNV